MGGYIGSKASVTQVDGYNRTEADDRYVNASGDTMTGALALPTGGLAVGVDQLVVDASGRVTMPYQPHFVVKANYGSHTVLNAASPDWSVVYRNNGGHFNTSTDTFTVPVTGLYFFRTHSLIEKSANSGNNYGYAQFYFNGSSYNDVGHTPSNGTTSYFDVTLTVVVYLQAGDTAQARYTTV